MSLVAALPTPPSPPVMQFLTHPSLGTMPTGVDTNPRRGALASPHGRWQRSR